MKKIPSIPFAFCFKLPDAKVDFNKSRRIVMEIAVMAPVTYPWRTSPANLKEKSGKNIPIIGPLYLLRGRLERRWTGLPNGIQHGPSRFCPQPPSRWFLLNETRSFLKTGLPLWVKKTFARHKSLLIHWRVKSHNVQRRKETLEHLLLKTNIPKIF